MIKLASVTFYSALSTIVPSLVYSTTETYCQWKREAIFDFDTPGVFGCTIEGKHIEATPVYYSNPDIKVKNG